MLNKSRSLPTVKLSKFDELGHLTNFDKWSPNSIQNVPGPIELKFMPFFNKLCLQKVSNGSRKTNLPIPKNGQKNFSDLKMFEMSLAEISASPNRPFWGGTVKFFSRNIKGSRKPSQKIFDAYPTILGLWRRPRAYNC